MKSMKLLSIIILFTLLVLNGCIDVYNDSEVNTLINNYSDQRPYPNVISERDMLKRLITQVRRNKDSIKSWLLLNPINANSGIGEIVLVEDIDSPFKEEQPYYYFVTLALPDNSLTGAAEVYAMDDNSLNTGKIQDAWFGPPKDFPKVEFLTKTQALEILRKKLNLKESDSVQIKAVFIFNRIADRFLWGWAMKINSPVAIKTLNGNTMNASVFWLNPINYSSEAISLMKTDYRQIGALKETSFAILNKDVFDSSAMSKYNTLSVDAKRQAPLDTIPVSTREEP